MITMTVIRRTAAIAVFGVFLMTAGLGRADETAGFHLLFGRGHGLIDCIYKHMIRT
jgi:hypothetical protein